MRSTLGIALPLIGLVCASCGESTNGGGTSGSTSSSGAAGSATSSTSTTNGSTSTASGSTSTTSGTGGASGSGAGTGGSTGSGGSSAGGGAGSTGSGGAAGSAGSSGLQATQVSGGYFPAGAPWYQDVSGTNAKVASDSTTITQWMQSYAAPNGFGGAGMAQQHGYFTVDLSIVVVDVPAGTAKRTYQTVTAFHASPDCDTAPIPVPQGGAVEGFMGMPGGLTGYQCAGFAGGDDCHMLFLARDEHRLYEAYHATIVGSTFSVGCLALWDTSRVYDDHGRGDQCTSADAAGYPMAPLLFTAEEIAAGSINHAIRFALPNDMLRAKVYVPPATHGTNTTGPTTSLPYGARMRLKTPYAGMSQLSPAAQIVARALQKYGMFHADGGNVPLMGQNDVLGKVKYADVGFDTHALMALKATDFEVIEYATPVPVTFNCMRTPIAQ